MRVIVRLHDIGNGGAHALAQLAHAFKYTLAIRSVWITTPAPRWDALYRTNSFPVTPNPFQLEPGDIIVDNERWFTPLEETYTTNARAVKRFIWELGDIPLSHANSKYFGHSLYTRDFLRLPRRALVRAHLNMGEWAGVPSRPEDAAPWKDNVVLVDNENGPLGGWLRSLESRFPGYTVIELQGMSREQVVDAFKRAKVCVDASLRGAERVCLEAMLYYAVPVLEDGRNAANEFDFPLPESLRFDLDRDRETGKPLNDGADMLAKVEAVVGDWRAAVDRIAIARAFLFEYPRLHVVDVARMFSLTLHVHVLGCGAQALPQRAAALSAAAIHFLAPAASTSVHVSGAGALFEETAGTVLSAARAGQHSLAFMTLEAESGLCSAGGGDARAALRVAPFGTGDVGLALSWRALPLHPLALEAWQAAFRASPSPVSVLRIEGVVLGVMYRPESVPNTMAIKLGSEGEVVGAASTTLIWPPPSEPMGAELWADILHLDRIASVAGLEVDEAAVDQLVVLQQMGIDPTDPHHELPGYGALLRLLGEPQKATSFLCSHVDFRRVAVHAELPRRLCENDAVLAMAGAP